MYAFRRINYTETNPETYESIYLSLREKGEERLFDTGDFVQDWYDCIKYVIQNEVGVVDSSATDHFIMDGAPYDSAYLHENEDGEWELSYDYMEGKIEFFVNKGERPTWEQLKEQYGEKK